VTILPAVAGGAFGFAAAAAIAQHKLAAVATVADGEAGRRVSAAR